MKSARKETVTEAEQAAAAAIFAQLAQNLAKGSPDKTNAALAGLTAALSLATSDRDTARWLKQCVDAITPNGGLNPEVMKRYLTLLRDVRVGVRKAKPTKDGQ